MTEKLLTSVIIYILIQKTTTLIIKYCYFYPFCQKVQGMGTTLHKKFQNVPTIIVNIY